MAELFKNNEELDTGRNFEVSTELKNPACYFDEVGADKSLDIEVPRNDTTDFAFSHVSRFDRRSKKDDRTIKNIALRHRGTSILEGSLVIQEANQTNYSGWLRSVLGDLSVEMKNKLITQISLPENVAFTNKINYDPLVDDYCTIRIFNQKFWLNRGQRDTWNYPGYDLDGNPETKKEETELLTIKFYEEAGFFINATNDAGTGVKTSSVYGAVVVSPFLFVHKVVEYLLNSLGFAVGTNFLRDDPKLRNLTLYHNFNISKLQYTTTQTIITKPVEIGMVQFASTTTQKVTGYSFNTSTFNYKDLLPRMTLGNFILAIQNTWNVMLVWRDNHTVDILDRQQPLKIPGHDIAKYLIGKWQPGTRKDLCLKFTWEHDNKDQAFSDNFSSLDDIRENIQDPVDNYAQLPGDPELDEIRLVRYADDDHKAGFYQFHLHKIENVSQDNEVTEVEVLDWEFISVQNQNYYFNDGDRDMEEINCKASTVLMSSLGYPYVSQQGNSEAFKSAYADFSLRFLFYTGSNSGGDSTDSLKIDFDGPNGILAKRYNLWAPFWANRLPVKRNALVPGHEFEYIKKNIFAAFRDVEGEFILQNPTVIAGKSEYIGLAIEGFKKEDNFWAYSEGVVPGSDETPSGSEFNPLFIGINESGRPYLINAAGDEKAANNWGSISQATDALRGYKIAPTMGISYNPATKQLYIAGQAGYLHIYSLADPQSIQLKSVKIFAGSDDLAGLRFLEYSNNILIGRQNTNHVYAIPCQADINNYTSAQVTAMTNSPCSGVARDFMNIGGFYFCITSNGELMKSNTPGTNWQELFDHDAHFTRLVATGNRYFICEDDDRPFWSYDADFADRHEFDIKANDEPLMLEGIAVGNNMLVITSEENTGARLVVDPANRDNLFTPSLAKYCGGAAYDPATVKTHIAIKQALGATQIASWSIVTGWQYISVPDFFRKLFMY